MEIYVSRHTKVDVPEGICYGQSDVSLLDSFSTEATVLQEKLSTDFDQVISSPLSRCALLANYFDETPLFEEALLEMNFGDWELQNWNAINPKQLQIWMDDFVHNSPPNGENMLALYNRVSKFMDNLRNKSYQKVLLVTHGGVIRCIWAYLLGIPLQNVFKITANYGQILHFNLGEHSDYDLMKLNI